MAKNKGYKNPIVHEKHTGVGFSDIAYPKQKSNYQAHIKASRGGRHKQFNRPEKTNSKWLRTRHRIKRRMVR